MNSNGRLRRTLRVTAFGGAAVLLVGAAGDCTGLGFLAGLLHNTTEGITFVDGQAVLPPLGPLVGAAGVNRTGTRLSAPSAAVGAEFGACLALSVDPSEVLAVGAPADAPGGVATGAAYVFERASEGQAWDTGTQIQPPAGVAAGARFGEAVALSPNLLVVGAPGYAPRGAAFVFERSGSTWRFAAQLAPIEATPGARFGSAVAVLAGQDPLILVGAPDDPSGGRVDVFRKRTLGGWSWDYENGHTASLRPHDVLPGDRFGASLSALDERVAIGAPGADIEDPQTHAVLADAGSAYAYAYDGTTATWGAPFALSDSSPRTAGRFGTSVALGSDGQHTAERLVVGAPGPADGPPLGGRVHVYGRRSLTPWGRDQFWAGAPGLGTSVGSTTTRLVDRFAVAEASASSRSVGLWERYGGAFVDVDLLGGAVTSPPTDDGFGSAIAMEAYSTTGKDFRVLVQVGAPRDGSSGAVHEFLLSAGDGIGKAPGRGAEPSAPVDRYVGVVADAGRTMPASAELSLDRPLRPPFRVEIAAGSFDASRRSGLTGGTVALRLARRASDPVETTSVVARFTAAGLEISGATDAGAAGSLVAFPGTWIADLAAEYDGAELRLEARPHGSGPFIEVAAIAVAGATFAPSVRFDGIGAGAEAGIDEPRVVTNAAPPQDAPPEETIAGRIYEAMDRQLETMSALDAGTATASMLDAAAAKLGEARTALDSLAAQRAKKPATGPTPARTQVKKALAAIAAAKKKIVKQKPRKAIDKLIAQAFAAESRALAALAAK